VVNELAPIVGLNGFVRKLKLGLSVGKEVDYVVANIRFIFEWEKPAIVRKIIDEHQIVTTARDTKHRRCPNITMN